MNIEIADRLVNLRKANGLSQENLAEKLGISRQAVSKWERAEASPDTDNLIALARLYKISLDELLLIATEAAPPNRTVSAEGGIDGSKFSGIHLKSNDGELYIGRNGIYASDVENEECDDRKESIHIVCNGENYTFAEARKKWGHPHSQQAVLFILTMAVILVYVTVGVFYGIWHPTWMLFWLIPISSRISSAIQRKDWQRIPYPLIITASYLTLGFLYEAWHPAWILFLTIPLYYSLLRYFRQRKGTMHT